MCMELYHGDEQYIEAEERETEELKYWSFSYDEPKINNDPNWA